MYLYSLVFIVNLLRSVLFPFTPSTGVVCLFVFIYLCLDNNGGLLCVWLCSLLAQLVTLQSLNLPAFNNLSIA